jgi:transitional endoplasmic reticulum ATPase
LFRPPYGTRIAILPFKNTVDGLSGDLFDIFLKSYFALTRRPICKLDIFTVSAGIRTIEFQVT